MRPQIAVEAERFPDQFRVHRALCDALTAAWAERDRWIESARQFCQNEEYWRERAERAEAQLEIKAKKVLEQHAALARVQALCDDPVGWATQSGMFFIPLKRVRAAITGP
jgi:hypothetical protein